MACLNPLPEFSWLTRQTEIELLRSKPTTEPFDVLVVGGGITGAAVARDAAGRGLKVLLVEKNDFASGTSSRSSKLVHGGVRYLEQFEFALVMESTRERALLWHYAPQLVTPLPFLFPAFKNSRVPLWKLAAGLWLYDILARFRAPTMHRTYFKERCLIEEPALRSDGLTGAIFYWDGATDDSLLTLANIVDARLFGATALPRISAEQIELSPIGDETPHIVMLKDTLSGETFPVRCRSVVAAGGPWTDIVLGQSSLKFPKLMATTRGSHIVVPHEKLPTKHALAMTHPTDGRVLFTIPWGDFTVIGTTDIFDEAAPEKVAITADEVKYLIDSTLYYYPQHPLSPIDVVSTWSGLRPLIAPPDSASASEISREHHLEWRDEGLVVIAGGKLTTHREMAEQTVDLLLRKASSWKDPIAGGFRPSPTSTRAFPILPIPLAPETRPSAALGATEATKLSLEDIREICRTLSVMSIEDLFVRRTQIFYKEPANGWKLLPKLKTTLCEALGWNESTWLAQVESYKNYLDTNVLNPLGRSLP